MSSTRPTDDVASAARRMTRALGERIGNGTPDELELLTGLQAEVEHQLGRAIQGLRAHGHTDGEIAAVLGVSRQAVSKRWPDNGRRRGAAARYAAPQS